MTAVSQNRNLRNLLLNHKDTTENELSKPVHSGILPLERLQIPTVSPKQYHQWRTKCSMPEAVEYISLST